MLIYTDIKMKEVIRKILKEDNENMKEKIKSSFQTLLYIIESNTNTKFIEEVSLEKVNFYDNYGTIEGFINVKSYCEDPDVGSFTRIVDEIDTELYSIIKKYEFNRDGSLKKQQERDAHLIFLFSGCQWDYRTNELHMKYVLIQDGFRSL